MKKIVFILCLMLTFSYAEKITIINGKVKSIDVKNIPAKYIEKFTIFEPYESKNRTFEGISLKNFTTLYGNNPSKINITAIDYFVSKFNVNDINNGKWIFVFKQDGKYLTPKEKGPARIIDKTFQLQDKKLTVFDQWVWMIEEVEFK
jgi:hypothetical protein